MWCVVVSVAFVYLRNKNSPTLNLLLRLVQFFRPQTRRPPGSGAVGCGSRARRETRPQVRLRSPPPGPQHQPGGRRGTGPEREAVRRKRCSRPGLADRGAQLRAQTRAGGAAVREGRRGFGAATVCVPATVPGKAVPECGGRWKTLPAPDLPPRLVILPKGNPAAVALTLDMGFSFLQLFEDPFQDAS